MAFKVEVALTNQWGRMTEWTLSPDWLNWPKWTKVASCHHVTVSFSFLSIALLLCPLLTDSFHWFCFCTVLLYTRRNNQLNSSAFKGDSSILKWGQILSGKIKKVKPFVCRLFIHNDWVDWEAELWVLHCRQRLLDSVRVRNLFSLRHNFSTTFHFDEASSWVSLLLQPDWLTSAILSHCVPSPSDRLSSAVSFIQVWVECALIKCTYFYYYYCLSNITTSTSEVKRQEFHSVRDRLSDRRKKEEQKESWLPLT